MTIAYTRIGFYAKGGMLLQMVELDLGNRTRPREASRYLRVWLARMMAYETASDYVIKVTTGSIEQF